MDYEKKYKEALEVAKRKLCFDKAGMVDSFTPNDIYEIFPELKESEDERIRKTLVDYFTAYKEQKECGIKTFYGIPTDNIIVWLEKQGEAFPVLSNSSNIGKDAWSEEEQNRFAKGVLTSCAMSFIDYLDAHKYEGKMCVSNGECEDIENAFHNAMWDRLHRYYCKYIERQGEHKPIISNNALREGIAHFGITQYQIDNWLKKYVDVEKQGGQKPVDKVEPKFKVKYAGNEYNVFATKNIAGVTYYGIEDELNHIDYVQAENCERVDGYSIKESGSPFPTKPAKFSEQNSTWSEEDEAMLDDIIDFLEKGTVKLQHDLSLYASWLKSLKYRYTWKPSGEQKQEEKPRYNIGDVICDKSCTTLNKEAQPNMEIVDIQNGMYICDKGSFPVSQQDEYELVSKKIDTKLNDHSVSNELRAASVKHAEKELKNHTFPNNEEFELIYTFEEGAKWNAAQKHNWSDEDEEELKIALNTLEEAGQYSSAKWLKNVCLVPQTIQKPTEWSEEDEEIIRTIISDGIRGAEFDMLQIGWLKSLKERYTWKPSDEQMYNLSEAAHYDCAFFDMEILKGLYDDLKKLREE